MVQDKIEIPTGDIQLLFVEAVLSIAEVGKALLADVQVLQKTQLELLEKYTNLINESLNEVDISQAITQDREVIKFSGDYEKSIAQLRHCNQFLEILQAEYSQFQSASIEERFVASKHLLPKLTFLKTKVSRDDFNEPLDFKTLNSNP